MKICLNTVYIAQSNIDESCRDLHIHSQHYFTKAFYHNEISTDSVQKSFDFVQTNRSTTDSIVRTITLSFVTSYPIQSPFKHNLHAFVSTCNLPVVNWGIISHLLILVEQPQLKALFRMVQL